MQPISQHQGLVMPLDRVNVDTDQMVPKQFLKALTRKGFGRILFYDWRYLPGEVPNPEFVLNLPRYRGASVLLARANFGCGSSREHAPWAILDYGFRVLIAPSFADIFYNNCFKNGILPITLPDAQVEELFKRANAKAKRIRAYGRPSQPDRDGCAGAQAPLRNRRLPQDGAPRRPGRYRVNDEARAGDHGLRAAQPSGRDDVRGGGFQAVVSHLSPPILFAPDSFCLRHFLPTIPRRLAWAPIVPQSEFHPG